VFVYREENEVDENGCDSKSEKDRNSPCEQMQPDEQDEEQTNEENNDVVDEWKRMEELCGKDDEERLEKKQGGLKRMEEEQTMEDTRYTQDRSGKIP